MAAVCSTQSCEWCFFIYLLFFYWVSGGNILAYIVARSLTLPRLCEQSAVPHLNHAALKAAAGRKRREAWARSAAAIGRLHCQSPASTPYCYMLNTPTPSLLLLLVLWLLKISRSFDYINSMASSPILKFTDCFYLFFHRERAARSYWTHWWSSKWNWQVGVYYWYNCFNPSHQFCCE